MSDERDTQFAGFAKLLWREMTVTARKTAGVLDADAFQHQQCVLIAQRAYDLVKHTVKVVEYEQPIEAVLSSIPDMTTLPEAE